jgi:hypothetical protein
VNWIKVAKVKVLQQVLVNLQVPQMVGNFLTNCDYQFLKNILIDGVCALIMFRFTFNTPEKSSTSEISFVLPQNILNLLHSKRH